MLANVQCLNCCLLRNIFEEAQQYDTRDTEPILISRSRTLEAGKETGSNAKLLIRRFCKCELCSPIERFRISSWASGLRSVFEMVCSEGNDEND